MFCIEKKKNICKKVKLNFELVLYTTANNTSFIEFIALAPETVLEFHFKHHCEMKYSFTVSI